MSRSGPALSPSFGAPEQRGNVRRRDRMPLNTAGRGYGDRARDDDQRKAGVPRGPNHLCCFSRSSDRGCHAREDDCLGRRASAAPELRLTVASREVAIAGMDWPRYRMCLNSAVTSSRGRRGTPRRRRTRSPTASAPPRGRWHLVARPPDHPLGPSRRPRRHPPTHLPGRTR
jgi:hypothetical protein